MYLDHEHAEICSPLVPSAALLVLAMRDARSMVATCKKLAEQQVGPVLVSFNNTNRHGTAAWAFHANLLVARKAFDGWRAAQWEPLKKQWVPFLVTSLPLFGTGKVGAEHGSKDCRYQLAQRADFIDEEVGLATTEHKNLINTRDEPLADPDRYARLHVIAFDTNLCEYATWLKFGVSQVLLALIEEGVPLPDVTLKDPVGAMNAVSRDMTLQKELQFKEGKRDTAIGIQRRLAEAAAKQIAAGCAATSVPDAVLIVEKWVETLDELESRHPRLSRRLDWCAKLSMLRRTAAAGNVDDQKARVLDLRYAEVGGIFEQLEQAGAVDSLEDFISVQGLTKTALHLLPREQARAVLVNRFGRYLVEVDWDHVVVNIDGRPWFISMDDPLGGEDLLRIVNRAQGWEECARKIVQAQLAVPAVAVCFVACEGKAAVDLGFGGDSAPSEAGKERKGEGSKTKTACSAATE